MQSLKIYWRDYFFLSHQDSYQNSSGQKIQNLFQFTLSIKIILSFFHHFLLENNCFWRIEFSYLYPTIFHGSSSCVLAKSQGELRHSLLKSITSIIFAEVIFNLINISSKYESHSSMVTAQGSGPIVISPNSRDVVKSLIAKTQEMWQKYHKCK